MKKIIVHHKSPHHAQSSGYGRLVDYLDDRVLIDGDTKFPYRIAKFIGYLSKQNAGLYDSNSVKKELQLFKVLKKLNFPAIVHYLNAERDIRYLLKYSNIKDIKYVGTFHKPPNLLKQCITDVSYLKHLDAVICVGENQVGFVKDWLGINHVNYIPHGVDTHFFVPDPLKKSKTCHLLFVGQHLRDFDTFNYCIPKIVEQLPETMVTVVLRKAYASKITQHKNVRIFTGITDLELREFYQAAQVLFLPLKDVTACNSILEAMACGLPIITSQVGGMQAYLEDTDNILCENDKRDSFIESCVALLKNESQQMSLGKASRAKALDYEWAKVTEQVEHFYKTIA